MRIQAVTSHGSSVQWRFDRDNSDAEDKMFTLEAKTSIKYEPYGTLSVNSVRQWRETVDDFFSQDWQKLRDLILSLEESMWDQDIENLVAEMSASDTDLEGDELPKFKPVVAKSNDPIQKQRLDELAKKIEETLDKHPS